MKYASNIELVNASIINMRPELVEDLPAFDAADAGIIIYKDGLMYYNNGVTWVTIQVAVDTASPLITTLGTNWINNDFTFNPTDFNALVNVSGLDSNSTLFDVIAQLDAAIPVLGEISLADLSDVEVDTPAPGYILFFNGSDYVIGDINTLPDNTLQVSMVSLSDVQTSGLADNDGLFYDLDSETFINRKWWYKFTNMTYATNHLVTHNLNTRTCQVTVIDAETFATITPTSVTFTDVNTASVIIPTARPVYITVVGLTG
jgi:hypothetical protein